MSAFTRLSMGVKFGVQAPRSEVLTPALPGTRYFFSFSSVHEPRSEQLADEPIAPRILSLRLSSSPAPASDAQEYWSASWRRAVAPTAIRSQPTVRVVWSKRVGM